MLFEEAYPKSAKSDRSQDAAPAPTWAKGDRKADTYVMQGLTSERRVTTYHLILAPTHACNLRCQHCYLPDHTAHAIPKDVALRLIHEWDEIAAEETPGRRGIFHVKGGEPLVYKPLLAMLEALRNSPHLHFMMTTNGTLFRKAHWQALSELNEASNGAVTVVVSLDGASAITHELLRGDGSFEPTVRTLRGLQSRGIRTYINCVLHAENLQDLDGVVDLALSLDVAQVNFLPFVPKGYGQEMRKRQLPQHIASERLRDCYLRLPEKDRQLLAGSLPDIVAGEEIKLFSAAHECVAAYRGLLYIKPDGFAFTCPNLENTELSVGNVTRATLKQILDNLSELYHLLHSDGQSDRYICMGERRLYERLADSKNLANLVRLQNMMPQDQYANASAATSFCVSRNW
jgi:MoaA/NifB/PqqE/SkfB family radical SAM enzyme